MAARWSNYRDANPRLCGMEGWDKKTLAGWGIEEAYVGSSNQGVVEKKEKYPEKLIFLWSVLIRKK